MFITRNYLPLLFVWLIIEVSAAEDHHETTTTIFAKDSSPTTNHDSIGLLDSIKKSFYTPVSSASTRHYARKAPTTSPNALSKSSERASSIHSDNSQHSDTSSLASSVEDPGSSGSDYLSQSSSSLSSSNFIPSSNGYHESDNSYYSAGNGNLDFDAGYNPRVESVTIVRQQNRQGLEDGQLNRLTELSKSFQDHSVQRRSRLNRPKLSNRPNRYNYHRNIGQIGGFATDSPPQSNSQQNENENESFEENRKNLPNLSRISSVSDHQHRSSAPSSSTSEDLSPQSSSPTSSVNLGPSTVEIDLPTSSTILDTDLRYYEPYEQLKYANQGLTEQSKSQLPEPVRRQFRSESKPSAHHRQYYDDLKPGHYVDHLHEEYSNPYPNPLELPSKYYETTPVTTNVYPSYDQRRRPSTPTKSLNQRIIEAAIHSKHSVETYYSKNLPKNDDQYNPLVDINSGPLPLTLRFNSQSSDINAEQNHHSKEGKVKKSFSIDEADLLIHTVKKPVIQQIKEIIQPYRQRTQEVRPVQERIETVIAKSGLEKEHGVDHPYQHQQPLAQQLYQSGLRLKTGATNSQQSLVPVPIHHHQHSESRQTSYKPYYSGSNSTNNTIVSSLKF